ncbi:hypothetical protein FGIG_06971 [Fasciola gigantica]|uniref:Uncharacterized protein n=1 Tax=Fasciola gigantica TaxID=46835 RepID=A0A504YKH4_FASGI|nr:hypothetical protein FGIG_06971 [Fasciola gigantica]
MWADSADTRARTPLGPATDWSPSGSSSSVGPGFSGHRRSTGRVGRATSAIPADDGCGVSLGHVPLWPPPASTGLRSELAVVSLNSVLKEPAL